MLNATHNPIYNIYTGYCFRAMVTDLSSRRLINGIEEFTGFPKRRCLDAALRDLADNETGKIIRAFSDKPLSQGAFTAYFVEDTTTVARKWQLKKGLEEHGAQICGLMVAPKHGMVIKNYLLPDFLKFASTKNFVMYDEKAEHFKLLLSKTELNNLSDNLIALGGQLLEARESFVPRSYLLYSSK